MLVAVLLQGYYCYNRCMSVLGMYLCLYVTNVDPVNTFLSDSHKFYVNMGVHTGNKTKTICGNSKGLWSYGVYVPPIP
jgi:hypothetical protein